MKQTIVAVFIGALIGSTTALAANNYFNDLAENAWYTDAVSNLANKGIIEGYSDQTFKPANNVNRAELAVILDRLIEYLEEGEVETSTTTLETNQSNATTSNTYSSDTHGLTFKYSNMWNSIESNSENNNGVSNLALTLNAKADPDVSIAINIPPKLDQYENCEVANSGINTQISSLNKISSQKLICDNGERILQEIYATKSGTSKRIQFLYQVPTELKFAQHFSDYLLLLKEIEFNE